MEAHAQGPQVANQADSLLRIVDELSSEITTYRHRQILAFRETVIAQALITYGAHILTSRCRPEPGIFLAAGLLCMFLSAVGVCMFVFYRKSIHYERDSRERLARQILGIQADDNGESIFYPRSPRYSTGELYSFVLVATGIATLYVNVARSGLIPW